jgi:hypothetical protein
MYKKSNLYEFFLFSMNGIAAIFIFLFVAYGNRLAFYGHYLFPCYLFLFFNIFGIVHFLVTRSLKFKFLLFKNKVQFAAELPALMGTMYNFHCQV